jgi:hypothetical protein
VVHPTGHEHDGPLLPDSGRLLVDAGEDDDLERTLEVLERHDGHGLAGPRHDLSEAGHDATENDPLAVQRLVGQVAGIGRHEVTDPVGDLTHRVLREIEPEQLLLPAETLPERSLADRRERLLENGAVDRVDAGQVEQRRLTRETVALGGRGRGEGIVETGQDRRRVAEIAQGSDLGQRLEDLAVGQSDIDPGAQVSE